MILLVLEIYRNHSYMLVLLATFITDLLSFTYITVTYVIDLVLYQNNFEHSVGKYSHILQTYFTNH